MSFSRLLLLIPILLVSCKGVEDITFTGISNVVFEGIENNKVNFSADVGIYNPSSVAFRVSEVNLKTSIDGTFLGTLTTEEPLKIRAKVDTSYHADFSLELANIMSGASLLYGISKKQKVTVEMLGYVRARSWLAFRKIEVSEKQTVDVPAFVR
jgi:hypothetical protein